MLNITKKVSTTMGIITIVIAAIVIFGAVYAYSYMAVQKVDGQLKTQLQSKTVKTHR